MDKEKFFKKCDHVMAFSFYAMIYFLPISGGFIQAFYIIAQITYFIKRGVLSRYRLQEMSLQKSSWWQKLATVIKSFLPIPNCLNNAMGIFILVNFLSIFTSREPSLSVKIFFAKLLQSCFIYFIFIESINNRKRIKNFFLAYICSLILITISGFFQFFTGKDFVRGALLGDGQRISAPFKHPNDYGGYLIIAVSLCLSYLVFQKLFQSHSQSLSTEDRFIKKYFSRPIYLLIYILFIFGFISLGFTFSRGAWLAWLGALLFMGGLLKKEKFWLPVVLGIVFLSIFYPLMIKGRNVSFVSDEVVYRDGNYRELPSLLEHPDLIKDKKIIENLKTGYVRLPGTGRVTFWIKAIDIIRDFPLLGVGVGVYRVVAPYYGLNHSSPHNIYLYMAGEIGFLGLGAFLWVLISIFRSTFKSLNKTNNLIAKSIIIGTSSGLFGFFIQCFFDTNFYGIQLNALMWLITGLLVSAQMIWTRTSN